MREGPTKSHICHLSDFSWDQLYEFPGNGILWCELFGSYMSFYKNLSFWVTRWRQKISIRRCFFSFDQGTILYTEKKNIRRGQFCTALTCDTLRVILWPYLRKYWLILGVPDFFALFPIIILPQLILIFINFGVFYWFLAAFKLVKLKELDQHEIWCQIWTHQ